MSYCRWSSNNWDCDVYCYEDVSGGYTTHIASNRIIGPIPQSDLKDLVNNPEKFAKDYNTQIDFIHNAKRENITLEYAGMTFNDSTIEEFLDRLFQLRDLGYHIPQYVFENITEEIRNDGGRVL